MNILEFRRLSQDAIQPSQKHDTDAGHDFYSAETVLIPPNSRAKVCTDIAINLRAGTEGHVRNRSGVFSNSNLILDGTVDVGYEGNVFINIHNTERGEHQVTIDKDMLLNLLEGNTTTDDLVLRTEPRMVNHVYTVKGETLLLEHCEGIDVHEVEEGTIYIPKGTKIAQMVIGAVEPYEWKEVDHFSTTDSERGSNGFGSSGY